jgi:hypothetical protein
MAAPFLLGENILRLVTAVAIQIAAIAYQPRSRHSSRCGRSAPRVVSPPWPG